MAIIGSLVGVRLLTELLAPEEYGVLSLAMTVVTLGCQVLFWPLGTGAARFYSISIEQGSFAGYLKSVRRLAFSATGIIALMILLCSLALFIMEKKEWILLAFSALIFTALTGCNAILTIMQNAARQRSVAALHQGIDSWARFLMAAAFILLLSPTSTAAMTGYIVALIFILGSQFMFFHKIIPQRISNSDNGPSWSNRILTYSWPLGAWGVLSWAQFSSDRWSLQLFVTTKEVGMYTVLFQLGYYPMTIIAGIINQFFTPIFFRLAGDTTNGKRMSQVHNIGLRITVLILTLTGCVFLIALFFHREIFRIFAALEYSNVSFLLPWMILAGGLLASGDAISLNLLSQMDTNAMIAPKVVTAMVGVILNFLGAFFYGIQGIVISFLIFSILQFFWLSLLSKKVQTE